MRYAFIYFFLLTCHLGIGQIALPKNDVQAYAEKLRSFEAIEQAPFSFYVKDLSNDSVIANINGQMSIPAASVMKLVTTASALKILGSKHQFKTKLKYSGYIDTTTHTLHGNLYIIGAGDPTLGSKYYNEVGTAENFLYQWADTVKTLGIQQIEGTVIADGSIYHYDGVPTGWTWGDLGNYYGAGPNGLTIFDNLVQLEFKTGAEKTLTELTCTMPYIPGFFIKNNVSAAKSNRDNAYVFGAPYSFDWFVNGSIPRNKESFIVKAANPDPELTFAIAFDYALNQTGIHTDFNPTTNRQLEKDSSYQKPKLTSLYTHYSPSLSSIIDLTNQRSVNLFAEHLLCEISNKRSGFGSTHNGALICKAYWKSKIGTTGLLMADGSGLSRSNAVSAKFLVELLNYMKGSQSLKNSLAISGKKGTMASIARNTSAHGRVYGKSGTMNKIKAYAGYVDTKTGKKLAYAMIINNYDCPTSKIKTYFQNLMIKMAEY